LLGRGPAGVGLAWQRRDQQRRNHDDDSKGAWQPGCDLANGTDTALEHDARL
jgi:hypothetical protein